MHPSILWLNGDVGVGKRAARGLVAADSCWRAADPEPLGTAPPELVVAGLKALAPTPERPVVVPLAIHDRETWQAVHSALQLRVMHIVLQPTQSRGPTWLGEEATVLHTEHLTPDEVVAALRAGWDRLCGRTI